MGSLERLAPALPTLVEAPPSALRGRTYGEDRLYLLVRDPHRVAAVWEITPALHARAERIARDARVPLRYLLRIEGRAREGAAVSIRAQADLPDALGGSSWYLTLAASGGECRACIGLERGGAFEPLLASGWVPVPPEGACAEEGAWDLTPEARAWLLASAKAAESDLAPSSLARFLQ